VQALKINNYDAEPMLRACGVSIGNGFTQVDGRVLPAPRVCAVFTFVKEPIQLLVWFSVIRLILTE
jgi:hypothetical protein